MLQYNEGEYATMWVDTSLIITPKENSQENPTTPSEPEKELQATENRTNIVKYLLT